MRPARTRDSLSLVEILLAFLILGLALLPVINLFSGAGRQVRQTSDYSLALTIVEKVAEELRLSNWENPHLPDQLEATEAPSVPIPIVDGESPFFRTLEDVNPPLGRIRHGEDPAITPSLSTLYREVKTFRFSLASKQWTGPQGVRLLDTELGATWQDFRSTTAMMSVPVRLGWLGSWTEVPELLRNRTAADELICSIFYPARSDHSLPAAAQQSGADLKLLRQVGDVVILLGGLAKSEPDFQTDVAGHQSRIASLAGAAKARELVVLARRYEQRAAIYLQVICSLSVTLADLATGYTRAKLGSPPPRPEGRLTGLQGLLVLPVQFVDRLDGALKTYAQAYNPPMGPLLPPRVRTRAFFKLLDLFKLRVLTAGPSDVSFLTRSFSEFVAYQDGRNPNFEDYGRAELDACRTIDALKTSYPSDRPEAWKAYLDSVGPAIAKITAP